MSRPIPRRLLPHTVTLRRPSGVDQYQQQTYEDTTLQYVRIEPANTTGLTDLGERAQDTAVLFVDVRNSMPSGIVIEQLDRVQWNGREYTVRQVDLLYADSSELHHREVRLT